MVSFSRIEALTQINDYQNLDLTTKNKLSFVAGVSANEGYWSFYGYILASYLFDLVEAFYSQRALLAGTF